MKNTVAYILISMLFQTSAFAEEITQDELKSGQCVSDALSKVYLTDPLAKSGDIKYVCTITCLNQKNIKSSIKVIHSESTEISSSGSDEMNRLKCKGVRIDVQKTELGYVLDQKIHSNAFYAQTSGFSELTTWAHSHDGLIPQDQINDMMIQMKSIFFKTGQDLMANTQQNPFVLAFAEKLLLLSKNTSESNRELQSVLIKIKEKYFSNQLDEIMLLQFVAGHADFLLTRPPYSN